MMKKKMKTVKFIMSTNFAQKEYSEEFEYDYDASEDELNNDMIEWTWEHINTDFQLVKEYTVDV